MKGNSEQAIEGELKSSMSEGWKIEETPKVEWEIGELVEWKVGGEAVKLEANSGGEVELIASEGVHIEAPNVHVKSTSFRFHWEPHLQEIIGFEVVGCGFATHVYGASIHYALMAYNNHLAKAEKEITHLEDKLTALENKPTTIVNSVTFIKNTAMLIIA